MAKLILIVIAIWLIFTILKRYRKGFDSSENQSAERQGNSEVMVQCAHCGVHLPESESIQFNGQFFCSQAHIHAPKDETED